MAASSASRLCGPELMVAWHECVRRRTTWERAAAATNGYRTRTNNFSLFDRVEVAPEAQAAPGRTGCGQSQAGYHHHHLNLAILLAVRLPPRLLDATLNPCAGEVRAFKTLTRCVQGGVRHSATTRQHQLALTAQS